MDNDKLKSTAAAGCGIITIVSFFLIGYSVTVLEPLNYGLEYNEKTIQVDISEARTSGRYFTGLGVSFLTFPIN